MPCGAGQRGDPLSVGSWSDQIRGDSSARGRVMVTATADVSSHPDAGGSIDNVLPGLSTRQCVALLIRQGWEGASRTLRSWRMT